MAIVTFKGRLLKNRQRNTKVKSLAMLSDAIAFISTQSILRIMVMKSKKNTCLVRNVSAEDKSFDGNSLLT